MTLAAVTVTVAPADACLAPDTRVRFSATFPDALTGDPADPDDVLFFIKSPDGITAAAGGWRDGIGRYHIDLVLDQAGPWIAKVQGTGAIEITSADIYVTVHQTALA